MQVSPNVLFVALALPFLAAAFVPVVYRVLGNRTAYFGALVAAISFLSIASQFGADGTLVSLPWISAPGLEVTLSLYVDGLAVLVGFLASGIGVLIFTYSGGYMAHEPGKRKFYATMLVFMGSMIGVALAADLVALFVFWELTSISSFVLIGHYQREDDSQYGARKSMLITVAGGLFMLLGFLLLDAIGGTFLLTGPAESGSLMANAELVRQQLRDAGLFVPVIALIGIGAAAKSAQVPLHIWLPNAMEAPTPVSAFLHSATMVKAGVYLVGRFRPLLVGDVLGEWTLAFAVLGLVSMTITAILAVAATDIKELLAYSTASHLGLIIAGFGIANEIGAETGAFHILNHAVFKAALFLVAGIVAHEAGTRMIDDLGGLAQDLPITAAIAVVASLGMAGVPPFNGFYSKEFLFEATYHVAEQVGGIWWLLPAIAVFGSIFTFLYSIRFVMLFFGEKPDELGHVHSPPVSMLAPPTVLAVLAGVIGLGGITATVGVHIGPIEQFVQSVIDSVVPHGAHAAEGGHGFSYHIPTSPKPAAIMSAITIGVGAVGYQFYGGIRDTIRRVQGLPPLTSNWYYDTSLDALDRTDLVPTYVQTGHLRTYALALFLAVSALTLGGYAATGVVLPGPSSFAITNLPVAVMAPIVIVLGVAVIAAIAVTNAPSHIAGVLTLSILGFMIAIFYILGNAPDLALTQLVIETLVLVLFLLVLDKLPAFYGEISRLRAARDAVVSAVVGLTVFMTALISTGAQPNLEYMIAQFFVLKGPPPAEHPPVLFDFGGGGNIVNVILVDFRAFDTMGEISVIAMAALSVITLIAMRERGESQ